MKEKINLELATKLYHDMLLIRLAEQHIVDVYHTDVVKSPVHLSIGQEAISAAICQALSHDDLISNTYRSHATYIAKGGNLNQMMAELYGKSGGCARGKAGSMHLVDIKNGIIGTSAVVGTTIPVAAGFALALKQEFKKTGKQKVIISVFGDGATEEGCFYETLNFAVLQNLPIIFICENNNLAIHSPLEKRWGTNNICKKVESFGIQSLKIDDGDVFKISDAINKSVNSVRENSKPLFLELKTYRWLEHVGPADDHDADYRNVAELNKWQKEDQILKLEQILEPSTVNDIKKVVDCKLQEAIDFAKSSSFPVKQELYDYVYAN